MPSEAGGSGVFDGESAAAKLRAGRGFGARVTAASRWARGGTCARWVGAGALGVGALGGVVVFSGARAGAARCACARLAAAARYFRGDGRSPAAVAEEEDERGDAQQRGPAAPSRWLSARLHRREDFIVEPNNPCPRVRCHQFLSGKTLKSGSASALLLPRRRTAKLCSDVSSTGQPWCRSGGSPLGAAARSGTGPRLGDLDRRAQRQDRLRQRAGEQRSRESRRRRRQQSADLGCGRPRWDAGPGHDAPGGRSASPPELVAGPHADRLCRRPDGRPVRALDRRPEDREPDRIRRRGARNRTAPPGRRTARRSPTARTATSS